MIYHYVCFCAQKSQILEKHNSTLSQKIFVRNSDRQAIQHDVEILPTSMIDEINQVITNLENYEGDLENHDDVNPHTIGGAVDDYFVSAKDDEHNIVYLYFEFTDETIIFKKLSKSF